MNAPQHLARPEGRIAYDDGGGDGPLVVCVPGMGQVRQCYRLLRPHLMDRGHRVVAMDLRGHGDSDSDFTAYDDEALADDILALLEELGEPAVVVGNSMGAGAAVIAAAREPDRVAGLALLGPFVRDPDGGALQKLMFRVMMTKPWGPAAFLAYYPQWFPGDPYEGYEEDRERVADNLRRPGHWRALVRTSRTSHAPAERALPRVTAPTVVVMGEADVDWEDPVAEAGWVGTALDGEVVSVPGVGHYPQLQAPSVTAEAVGRVVDRPGS